MTRRPKAADAAACVSAPDPFPAIDHAALFPGLRARHDGWTAARTQRFLDALARTGCIEDACRVAGMSDVGARRMKAKYPAFATAWEAALARAHKGLIAIAWQRAVEGRETIIIRKGEEVERRIAPSDAILSLLIKRGDLRGGGLQDETPPVDPAQVLTWDEYRAGWRFDADGDKYDAVARERIFVAWNAELDAMRDRMCAAGDGPA
ncbi:MAG TPA: hypothetical protein PKA59_00265 [Chakrabartia sp.]|mgnify:CR=1 FL=1|jgi:hypothetical protein|nr:hypothetical protein [Chakrabartia sp.]